MTRICLSGKCLASFHSLRLSGSRCYSCGGRTVRWRPGIENNKSLFPKSNGRTSSRFEFFSEPASEE